MSIQSVGVVEPQRKSNLVRNTSIAAGIGAGWGAANSIITQKFIMKDPILYHNTLKTMIQGRSLLKGMAGKDSLFLKFNDRSIKKFKNLLNSVGITKKNAVFENGVIKGFNNLKMSWKDVAKTAGKGAIIVGGIYLAYRGIKSLFTK